MHEFKDYNKELKILFLESKLSKVDFCNRIGIKKQNLNPILENKLQLRKSSFDKYNDNFAIKNCDVIRSADGHSVDDDDMHWTVSCPTCERDIEYTGYFDSGDMNKCKCGTEFKTRRVYFDSGSYME